MEDVAALLKRPKSECLVIWVRLPRDTWPKSWHNIEKPVVPLERNLYGLPLSGLVWKRQLKIVYSGQWMEESTNLGMLVLARQQGLFLPVYVDDSKMAGKKHNLELMWKKWIKHVDLEKPCAVS